MEKLLKCPQGEDRHSIHRIKVLVWNLTVLKKAEDKIKRLEE
jgi:hypothetical protein